MGSHKDVIGISHNDNGNDTGRSFTVFMDLPTELRAMIWKACIPIRILQPYYGVFDCLGHSRSQWAYPLISKVCREAKGVADLCVSSFNMVLKWESPLRGRHHAEADVAWSSKSTTLVYLTHLYPESSGSDEVLNLARDPAVSLLIGDIWSPNSHYTYLLDRRDRELMHAITVMYDRYIQPRSHVFVCCKHIRLEFPISVAKLGIVWRALVSSGSLERSQQSSISTTERNWRGQ